MILSALNDYYDRLSENGTVPSFGYSEEKISYALIISHDGKLVDVQDIRENSGNKPVPKSLEVPASFKRPGTQPRAFFMWDNSAYVLGVRAKKSESEIIVELTPKHHGTFKSLHESVLANSGDLGAVALRKFLSEWSPSTTDLPLSKEEILNANFIFRLDGERSYLHERDDIRDLLPDVMAEQGRLRDESEEHYSVCLVSGTREPVERIHPAIKGAGGKQAETSIVSFNKTAFDSYGKKQGANSPVSKSAAFAYTTALNYLLRGGSHHRQRLKIGDAAVVFWAVAESPGKAAAAELTFANMLEPPVDDAQEAAKLRSVLDKVSAGRPLQELDANLDPETRIYLLGLAPNASRLSIRFWETGSLEMFAKRLADHYQDLRIEPLPWKSEPAIWRLLYATAPSRDGKAKPEDIPPQLAGEMTRAILTGRRYPRSLLANTVMRFRADGNISGLRIALCKAILTRDLRLGVKGIEEEIFMSLDRETKNPGYRLGRLFAELENVQKAALGSSVNATIRDRYFGAASATPASVFPVLLRNVQHHLGRLRKDKPGLAVTLEREIGEIMDGIGTDFPRSLRIEDQGRFAIGYYHQSKARFASKEQRPEDDTDIND